MPNRPRYPRGAAAGSDVRGWTKETAMKANIGSTDRVVRVIVGLVVIGAGAYFQGWWGLIGLLPLLTAALRFCPAYVPFGITTCPEKTKEPPIPPGGPKPA
jgi:hypothetical protein